MECKADARTWFARWKSVLIEPKWNVKKRKLSALYANVIVLIEPKWNVKSIRINEYEQGLEY